MFIRDDEYEARRFALEQAVLASNGASSTDNIIQAAGIFENYLKNGENSGSDN